MKFFAIIISILLIGFLSSALNAGQVYTWTDEDGNLHVTDTPPPPKSKVKDTLEYREKTAAEIQALKQDQRIGQDQKREEAVHRQADLTAKRAAEADQAAQEASLKAAEAYENAMQTYNRYGKTKDKRKKFKKRLRRAFDAAEAAQARASEAAENARQAREVARSARKEAEELEAQNQ
jgi:prolyl oligopeptidase PreP (S9A serine peptidase family)